MGEKKGSNYFSKVFLNELYAYGSEKNKKQSKINAVKHLMSIIESNLDMQKDFDNFMESFISDTESSKNDILASNSEKKLYSCFDKQTKAEPDTKQFLTNIEAQNC